MYLLTDENTGANICPLPFTPTGPAQRLMNGCGQFPGTVPLYHPATITENLQGLPGGVRGITAIRDGQVAWSGPITTIGQANLQTHPPTLPIVAREPSWWLKQRTLETDKHYNADLYYIVRDLVAYMLGKQSNGLTSGGTSINAALPGFTVAPASGNSGTVRHVAYAGVDRMFIGDILDDLVNDPTTGLDYKMVYGGTFGLATRTLTVGSPSLGQALSTFINEHVLFDFAKSWDLEKAATRAHVIGNGYTYTAQNTGSVTAGTPLLERVWSRPDISDVTTLQQVAMDGRRKAQPPVTPFSFSWTPMPDSGALPWGWCDLGDTVQMMVDTADSMLLSRGRWRISELDWMPEVGGAAEWMSATVDVPADSLGA